MKANRNSREYSNNSEIATIVIKAIGIVGGAIFIAAGVYIIINYDLSGCALIACGFASIVLALAL